MRTTSTVGADARIDATGQYEYTSLPQRARKPQSVNLHHRTSRSPAIASMTARSARVSDGAAVSAVGASTHDDRASVPLPASVRAMLALFESGDEERAVLELEGTARARSKTYQVNVCEYESVAMRAVCFCASASAVGERTPAVDVLEASGATQETFSRRWTARLARKRRLADKGLWNCRGALGFRRCRDDGEGELREEKGGRAATGLRRRIRYVQTNHLDAVEPHSERTRTAAGEGGSVGGEEVSFERKRFAPASPGRRSS